MKRTINVPESLKEITLSQYKDFLKCSEDIEGDFLKQRMVEKFCRIPLAEVLLIKLSSVNEIVNDLNLMFEGEQPLQTTFKLGSAKFGMIPNLDDMSFGEYIDLDTNITDWETMNKAMAVLFRPIISEIDGKYEIEPYNGSATYSEVMLFAPIDVVLGAVVFFYRLGNALIQATQSYLVEEVEEMSMTHQRNSTQIGDGTTVFTQSLKENLVDLMKLQDKDYTSVLPS